MNPKPVSEKSNNAQGCGVFGLSLVGVIFFLAGAFFFWFLVIQPVSLWSRAKSWPATEATIESAKIVVSHDDDGTTYRADFTYRYSVQGKEFVNDRDGLLEISGSRRSAKKRLQELPVGCKTTVYYDPRDPADSLLNRRLGWSLLFGLIPTVFIGIGGFIIWIAWFGNSFAKQKPISEGKRRSSAAGALGERLPGVASASGYVSKDDAKDEQFDQPLKLKPANSRLVVFLVVAFFAIFWNGIVSIFVVNVFADKPGIFEIGMGLFLIPFVLVGLGLMALGVYYFMSLFNPQVEIALSNGLVPLGGEVELAWQVDGNSRRIRKLEIFVKGEESATYQRGTTSYTDTETFLKIPVVETDAQDQVPFGSATVVIPPDTMHSFDSGDNQIKWTVEVQGDIPWWPDVTESFAFRVKP